MELHQLPAQTQTKSKSLLLKGLEPKHISDQAHGCTRTLPQHPSHLRSKPIWLSTESGPCTRFWLHAFPFHCGQQHGALVHRQGVAHGPGRGCGLTHFHQRRQHMALPEMFVARRKFSGCIYLLKSTWTLFLQPLSFIWQRNWCLSTRQARHSLVSNQGCVHKQKQHAVSTCTHHVPFSRHLSLFSMFSLLNNKLLVV